MTDRRQFTLWSGLTLLSCVFAFNCASSQAQKKGKYTCDEAQPASLCNESNTCGSPSNPCTIDVTRASNSADVKPTTPGGKKNQPFCLKTGTKVIWLSSRGGNGFMVSFGSDSPFQPDNPIMGGGKKHVTVTAAAPGCYRYDAGAFTSGTVYGMSGGNKGEFVILP